MQEQVTESRRGRAWSEAEDARLVEGVREGLDLPALAERHGRTTGGIGARLALLIPQPGPAGDEALEWLRARFARDAAYSWQKVLDERRRRTRRERRVRDQSAPASEGLADTAAADEVLAEWEQVTGHVLRSERRDVFLARQEVHDLTAVAATVRQPAARRLWQDGTQLLLDDWLLECVCPGAARLTADWDLIAERDDDTVLVLRELVAAAAEDVPKERDREILSRRLGLHDQPAQTQEKVAEALGISRERVRQLQTRALRSMARSAAPASRKTRRVLAELSCVDRVSLDTGPSAAERLLDLADVLLPSVTPRQAVPLLARLAGADKVRAENLAAEAATIRMLRHESARREATQQRRIERATERWAALETEVNWFGTLEPAPPRAELETLREENSGGRDFGAWHCPKLGRDVAYESETELRVVQLLSFAPQIAYYQEQPLAISYEFAGRHRTYYPDLLVATADGRCILIEVKPVYEMAMAVNVAKYRAVEAFCRSKGWGLVATDSKRTRRLLENRPVDPHVEVVLSAALDEHTELTWPQVQAALGTVPLDSLSLAALILKRGWEWSIRPYRLRSGTQANHSRVPSAPAAGTLQPFPPDAVQEPAALYTSDGDIPSPDDIEAARTPAGGWTRDQLAAWGIPWPPPQGWREQLITQWKAGSR
ncbi:TnsA endonuclease N-terminal domain-containing protein [Streptomyces graminilatus]|uniref:TnsA endonuclease N-terminal domain-containing protein n=1 Tax=Streptomyces graminilatus TaxID=1464070 RepID=UPI0006E19608|nr:TnsA endonuclease N-terminal domain-containing protein [Streptomyces graminilatus]